VTELRWGAEAPADEDAARARLVDAADACFARVGFAKTTVENVADEAKVSRGTVYRYFKNRTELIAAVVLRDAEDFVGELERQAASSADSGSPEDAVAAMAAGLVAAIRNGQRDERLGAALTVDAAGLVGLSELLFDPMVALVRRLLEPVEAEGLLRAEVDLDDAAEWILRVAASFCLIPQPERTDDELAAYLSRYLVSGLLREPVVAGRTGRSGVRARRNKL
jgi:AcrR family transcriptional regulator